MIGSYYKNLPLSVDGANDILAKLEAALNEPDKTGPNPLVVRFLIRFLVDEGELETPRNSSPDVDRLSREEKHFFKKNYTAILSKACGDLYSNFYVPFCKSEKAKTYPTPCYYEVFIPFKQSTEYATNYILLPKGVKVGERVPALIYAFAHKETPAMRNIQTPSFSFDEGISRNKYANYVDRISANSSVIQKETAVSLRYGIITLGEALGLRLRCYNIPLQCAYEMVKADVGTFIHASDDLYLEALNQNKKKVTFQRRPLRATMLFAALLWPAWECAKLSEAEKLDMLKQVMEAEGKDCYYGPRYKKKNPAEALRIRCHRLFGDQLRRAEKSQE